MTPEFFGIPAIISPLAPKGRITLFCLGAGPGVDLVFVRDAVQIVNIDAPSSKK